MPYNNRIGLLFPSGAAGDEPSLPGAARVFDQSVPEAAEQGFAEVSDTPQAVATQDVAEQGYAETSDTPAVTGTPASETGEQGFAEASDTPQAAPAQEAGEQGYAEAADDPSPSLAYYRLGAPTVDPAACGEGPGAAVVEGSTQDLYMPVSLTDAVDGAALDPTVSPAGSTAAPVRVAFTNGRDPAQADWQQAEWMTSSPGGSYYAAVSLSGLAAGYYFVFVGTAAFVGKARGVLTVF